MKTEVEINLFSTLKAALGSLGLGSIDFFMKKNKGVFKKLYVLQTNGVFVCFQFNLRAIF